MADVKVRKHTQRNNQQPSSLNGEGSETRHGGSMKRCKGCKQDLSHDWFYKDKNNKDGLNRYCKQCRSSYAKAYYKTEAGQRCAKRVRARRRKRLKTDPILRQRERTL